jgi:hypothetical protein
LRAAADIVRMRVAAFCNERRTVRRRCDKRSSGNARSIAMISARRRSSITSAPVRAKSPTPCELGGVDGDGDGPWSALPCLTISPLFLDDFIQRVLNSPQLVSHVGDFTLPVQR